MTAAAATHFPRHRDRIGGWLGAGVKVLDGVCIGDRAIVGAGAVVRDHVPDGATAVGVPARVLGTAGRDGR